eukprot:TRINITY_DN10220_c0_g1_i1.p1 TRINITY_DN10220_c0_g1~~TRINITY_DN10220_c0_g1_i1.p1  ORF type:complete len:143 (-),score=32.56 TRINITY_DN10220_c0_g1_i1:114-542(-)
MRSFHLLAFFLVFLACLTSSSWAQSNHTNGTYDASNAPDLNATSSSISSSVPAANISVSEEIISSPSAVLSKSSRMSKSHKIDNSQEPLVPDVPEGDSAAKFGLVVLVLLFVIVAGVFLGYYYQRRARYSNISYETLADDDL